MSKEQIKMWKEIKKVRLKKGMFSGLDVFSLGDLTEGKEYDVYGVTWKVYEDHSRELCYILKNDREELVLKTTSKFEIVK
jgi:hypothetical protein